MSELKPWPEYQEEINELLRMKKQLLGPQGCSCQSQQRNEWKAHCLSAGIYALSQLQRRAQPANEPLTIDELRGMDGEPVWVTHKDGSGGRWGIVNSYKGTGMCADLDSYTAYWFDDWCGTIAYRRKPEGSEE